MIAAIGTLSYHPVDNGFDRRNSISEFKGKKGMDQVEEDRPAFFKVAPPR